MKKTVYSLMLFLIAALLLGCGASDLAGTEQPVEERPSNGNYIYGEAMVESVDIMILESFPVQVNLLARGYLGDGCTYINEIQQERDGNAIQVSITTIRDADMMCTQALVAFEERIPLNVYGLAAGTYTVSVNGVEDKFTLDVDNSLSGTEDNPAVRAIVAGLSQELGIAPEAITVESVRSVEWPDSCLGVRVEGVACADVITPGYIIQLEVAGVAMVFHSNEDGRNTILVLVTE
jgi:inhibitor of cysteine peptidase